MRVVLTIHSADLYGAGRSLMDHALAMRGNGFDFTVLLPSNGPLGQALAQHGIAMAVSPSPSPAGFYRFATEQLRQMGRPLCHVHSTFPLVAALAARRVGCQILWHVREERQRSIERRPHGPRRWGSQALSELRRLVIASLADRVIFVSEATRRQFDFPRKPSDVLCNFLPEMPKAHPAKPEKEPLTILYAGRVCLEKGAEEFLSVCGILLERGVNFRAIMAGSLHPDYADVPARLASLGLSERICLSGYQLDVNKMFDEADVLLFPSHTEGFGRPVMEAMARGVVVVASRVGGIPEMIEHERTGFLFDPAHPREVVDIMARLAGDAACRRAIGRSARESAAYLFARDTYVSKMCRVYGEMADRVCDSTGGAHC